jgi:hypothetical protein
MQMALERVVCQLHITPGVVDYRNLGLARPIAHSQGVVCTPFVVGPIGTSEHRRLPHEVNAKLSRSDSCLNHIGDSAVDSSSTFLR